MATSQDLVPTGQPQGRRQETVAAMQSAGVPTSSESVSGGGGSPSGALAPAVAPPSAGGVPAAPIPNDFDVLANREPTEGFTAAPELDPVALFQARVDESPNSSLRYYFGRYQEFAG